MSLFDLPAGVPAAPKRAKAKTKPKPKLSELPAHVIRKLEDAGAVDTHSAGPPAVRGAYMISCPRCERPVMRGLLAMPTPWKVDADPQPLSRQGEALALLAGRVTYDLSWRHGHYELDRRGSWAWHHPDPVVGRDIVVEHRCGESVHWPTVLTALPPMTAAAAPLPPDAKPPY